MILRHLFYKSSNNYSCGGNKSGTTPSKFSRPSWTKMSEIAINTVEKIEVEQISLLTTCTTKLYKYHRLNLHFWILTKKYIKFNPLFHYPSPFIAFSRVLFLSQLIISKFLSYLSIHTWMKSSYIIMWRAASFIWSPDPSLQQSYKNLRISGQRFWPSSSDKWKQVKGFCLLMSTSNQTKVHILQSCGTSPSF